jgi:hypothetical protein
MAYGDYIVAEGNRLVTVDPYAGPDYSALWSPASYALRGLGADDGGALPAVPGSGGQLQEKTSGDTLSRAAYLLLMGVGGFVAGKAMAPEEKHENLYGVGGALLGLLAGPLGLGVLGGIALTTGREGRESQRRPLGGYR